MGVITMRCNKNNQQNSPCISNDTLMYPGPFNQTYSQKRPLPMYSKFMGWGLFTMVSWQVSVFLSKTKFSKARIYLHSENQLNRKLRNNKNFTYSVKTFMTLPAK